MSCYEECTAIRVLILKWSPAVLTGFNSIGCDEDMLLQAFYQNLYPVYLANTNGNSRRISCCLHTEMDVEAPDEPWASP
jgi:exonuclease I